MAATCADGSWIVLALIGILASRGAREADSQEGATWSTQCWTGVNALLPFPLRAHGLRVLNALAVFAVFCLLSPPLLFIIRRRVAASSRGCPRAACNSVLQYST
jgi:hypothetical protein